MKLIKELLYLIFVLFFTLPRSRKILCLKEMTYFPFKGYIGMMWCGRLIHHGDFEQWCRDKKFWIHENIHLYQAKTFHYLWLGYYLSYIWQWFIGVLWCGSCSAAYLLNPYEVEAYQNEFDECYFSGYTKDNIKKYWLSLKERRSLWLKSNKNKYILKENLIIYYYRS